MLIELILKVSVDELYWNWLNYMLLLRNGELEMNIDNVIVMWIVIEKWWIESEYVELFEIEWLVDNWLICVCCWEWCECGICWFEKWDEDWDVELLMIKEWLSYWDCGYVLKWWIMWNCLCLMVMS